MPTRMTRWYSAMPTNTAQEVPMNRVVEYLRRLLLIAQRRGDQVAVIAIEQRIAQAER